MEAKEAISEAKTLLKDLYSDENVSEIRLEEVEFDEENDSWLVTLGIMRPVVKQTSRSMLVSPLETPLKRTYKIVTVPDKGISKPSVKIRELRVDE